MSQQERNQRLNITSHETRRLRGDLIYIFKLQESTLFTPAPDNRTRGHSKKLVIENTNNNIRKHSFAARNINIWNSLPENIVNAENVNIFKNLLDSYFSNV